MTAESSKGVGGSRFRSERVLTVMAKPEAGLRTTREGLASVADAEVGDLEGALSAEGATLTPLFGVNEGRLAEIAGTTAPETGLELPDLSAF